MIASSAVPEPSMLTMSYASISRRLAQVTDEIKTAGDASAPGQTQTRNHFVAGTP
jgi:hypothetical protein